MKLPFTQLGYICHVMMNVAIIATCQFVYIDQESETHKKGFETLKN